MGYFLTLLYNDGVNDKKPLISVVMPAYNAERYISEAIESILKQSFKDFELIIIDDCSTDKTPEIIQKYSKQDPRIKTYRNETNMKLAKTLNTGIKHANGKYIARMDADDVSLPNRLEIQKTFMEKHPYVGILGGGMVIMNQNGEKISKRSYHRDDPSIRKHMFRFSPFCHPAVIIRKEAFDKTQGYKHEYNPAEDYEFYFQLGRFCEFANTDSELLRYRVVEGSMTTGKLKKMEIETIKIRFKYFLEYKGSLFDLLYTIVQLMTVYITPANTRIWLFTKMREKGL